MEIKHFYLWAMPKRIESKIAWSKVDVLKVGHHGSDTSSTEKFINTVKPESAIISVGKIILIHIQLKVL